MHIDAMLLATAGHQDHLAIQADFGDRPEFFNLVRVIFARWGRMKRLRAGTGMGAIFTDNVNDRLAYPICMLHVSPPPLPI